MSLNLRKWNWPEIFQNNDVVNIRNLKQIHIILHKFIHEGYNNIN